MSARRRRMGVAPTLVLAMAAVAGLALSVAYVVSREVNERPLEAFYESYTVRRDLDDLEDHRVSTGSWDGVEPLLERIARPFDERLLLTDPDLVVLADSDPGGPDLDLEAFDADVEFTIAGERVLLFTLGRANTTAVEQAAADLDREYVLASAVALLGAVGVAIVFGRRLARPLAEVATAAGRIGGGDLTTPVTERSPREVAEVAQALNATAERLRSAEEQRRGMVADVAHELRAPVANLRAYVEAMVDGLAEPEGDDLAVLADEVGRLERLIEDLQELALADAGQLRVEAVAVDVADLVGGLVDAVTPRARREGVALVTRIEPTAGAVLADPARAQQILANLVDNALRHGRGGSSVEVAAGRRGSSVLLSVRDHGPGLPPDQVEAVFDRFHRVDRSRSRASGGAGLGLAISRRLAELQGGTLTAANEVGGGARFTLSLPAAPVHDGVTPPP